MTTKAQVVAALTDALDLAKGLPDDGATVTPPAPPVQDDTGKPYAGMKLVLNEDFDTALDTLGRWWTGPKQDGGQWGGAHFVDPQDPLAADVYKIGDSCLTISAYHDPNYRDPDGWNRKWYSGQITACRPPIEVQAGVLRGYYEMKAKLPKWNGAWPAFWFCAAYDDPRLTSSDKGGIEVDIEMYGTDTAVVTCNVHDWPGNTGEDAEAAKNNDGVHFLRPIADYSDDFHLYGMKFTDDELICYFDNVEIQRMPMPKRAQHTRFWPIVDLAIREEGTIDIPAPGQAVSMMVDHVRIWDADQA